MSTTLLSDIFPLDDEMLHVFVLGTGRGESVLVAIPPGTWLVVDSFRRSGINPAVEVLRRAGVTPSAVVMTHPHKDHAEGLGELIQMLGPEGVVGCFSPLVSEHERFLDDDREGWLRKGAAEQALSSILAAWQTPARRWRLQAESTPRPFGNGTVRVLSPDDGAWARHQGLARPDGNELSAAMAVSWKSVQVVLGADLPSAGWQIVSTSSGVEQFAVASVYKVAHHGSKYSHHPVVMATRDEVSARGVDRRLVLAPYANGPRNVPSFADDNDVERLLGFTEEILMSSTGLRTPILPSSRRASRQQILQHSSIAIGGGLIMTSSAPRATWDESWVLISVGSDGETEASWGAGAVIVDA